MVEEPERRHVETEDYTAQNGTAHTLAFALTPRDFWDVTVDGEPVPGCPWIRQKHARNAAIRHIERSRA